MNRNTRFNKLIIGSQVYSVVICLIGAVVMLSNQLPFLSPLNQAIDAIFFDTMPSGLAEFKGFIYGILGMMVFAFGLLTFLIITNALSKKMVWAWFALMITYVLVFGLEIYFSVVYGMLYNIIFSAVYYPIMIVLLIFLKRDCIKRA